MFIKIALGHIASKPKRIHFENSFPVSLLQFSCCMATLAKIHIRAENFPKALFAMGH